MTNPDTAATLARKCWRTLEPYHGMIYFVPEAAEQYSAIGVDGRSGYFGTHILNRNPQRRDQFHSIGL